MTFFADTSMFFFFLFFVLHLLTALLGHQVQNNFGFDQKSFTNLIEIFFRYIFFRVLGPPYEQNKNFTYEVLGIKIG